MQITRDKQQNRNKATGSKAADSNLRTIWNPRIPTVIRKEHPKCFPEMRRSDWKPPPHTGAVLGRNIVPCLAPSKSAKRTPRKIQRTPRATRERKGSNNKHFKRKNSQELNPVKHTQRKARSFKEESKKNGSKTIKSQIAYNNSVCATRKGPKNTPGNEPPRPLKERQENPKKGTKSAQGKQEKGKANKKTIQKPKKTSGIKNDFYAT